VLRSADALDRGSDLSDADWVSLAGQVGVEGAIDTLTPYRHEQRCCDRDPAFGQ
jgi:hypothetical protein